MMSNSETEFKFSDWLAEGVHGVKSSRRRMLKSFMPKEFGKHVKAARKEMLLAVRSLLDDAIEHTEKDNHPKATSIKVE
jgi:hypothetical protein